MNDRVRRYGIGFAGGLAAGLLGVGGGVIVVPLLVAVIGIEQRRAHATSLAAIVPASAVATLVYASGGRVSVTAFAALAAGAVIGAPIGVWILARASERALALAFLAFAAIAGVRLVVT